MINREVKYERNLTGSYMKIASNPEGAFDEKMLLKRKLPGLLPVEKCYVDGMGCYWYNITGKQSLDTYCRMKNIGIEFVERMIVSICNQMEILEWNLMNVNGLVLDPELIYVTNSNREFIFSVYPGHRDTILKDFRQLMEYLITRIDHKDMQAVHMAYSIYEKTLDDSYSITDIRDQIIEAKNIAALEEKKSVTVPEEALKVFQKETKSQEQGEEKFRLEAFWKQICEKGKETGETLREFFLKVRKGIHIDKTEEKKESFNIIYPEKEIEAKAPSAAWDTEENDVKKTIMGANPTILLQDAGRQIQGILLYEGAEGYDSIRLRSPSTKIGQAEDVDAVSKKETISHYHARIDLIDEEYYIEDLNSKNGTYVNDEMIAYKERRKLNRNDVISFADMRYRFI